MNEQDFPILKEKSNGKRLVYLDNAATSHKPSQVIAAEKEFYEKYNSNVHRSLHNLSAKATEKYEDARKTVAKFINAEENQIVFTRGTTESLNAVAFGLKNIKKGDEIVLSIMEHHSNIVPWQQIAQKTGAILKFIPITSEFRLDMDAAKKLITNKTKIVALTHVSNVLGTINPIKEITKFAHEKGTIVVIDAAQSIAFTKVDVKDLDVDFLVFSSHKMFGPTGVGVLYGKKLEILDPFTFGGEMIEEVTKEKSTWKEIPHRFEAGTPNIAGVIGLAAAIDYIQSIGLDKIKKHEEELINYTLERIKSLKNVKIIGPTKDRAAILSFHIEGMHPHDVSEILNRDNIAIRGGHHCAMPLMKELKLPGCSRASFSFYNTKADVDAFIESLQKAMKVFKL